MSLDGLRDAYIREKKNEIATCELSRKRKLRELYNVNQLLGGGSHAPLEAPLPLRDWALNDEPSENERRFLDANDITKGLRFDDSTLPYPPQHAPLPSTLPFQSPPPPLSKVPKLSKLSPPPPAASVVPSLEDQLRAASASPSVINPPFPRPSVEDPAQEHVAPVIEVSPKSQPAHSTPQPESEAAVLVDEETPANEIQIEDPLEFLAEPPTAAQQPIDHQPSEATDAQEEETRTDPSPDGPSADPHLVVPPTVEDDVEMADIPSPVREEPKPPQLVQLHPQDVQEARLKETEQNLERAREKERKDDEKLAIPGTNAPPDTLSSPSSTVGPYSQATPYATHLSPDTSPDRESFSDHAPGPVQHAVELDPAAQQAKEEHERALQQRMQEARERARGDTSATPEVERQLEEEQAIRLARDGHSRLGDSEPAAVARSLTEHAEDVVQGIAPTEKHVEEQPVQETRELQEPQKGHHPDADSLPTPTTTVPEPVALERRISEVDEPVTTKSQELASVGTEHPTPPADVDVEMDEAPPAVEEREKAPPRPQSPKPERMTTRVSSGAMRQKSVSEIIGEKAAPKPMLTPRSSNVSATSASPARSRSRDQKGQDVSTVIFAKQDVHKSAKISKLYNEEYASLQGASEDSTRDYLIGLFQYQAHHLPRSLPLADLLASARKTVSTAGTLAVLREAQDYKILKRVYQLQNANRWSLRQLQKSAEPPRPVSQHDHLLAEMRWMQTDFKEERKWKRALAATFAEWCAEYVNSGPEERTSLRINARRPGQPDEEMNDAPTPDLIHSGANETENESLVDDEELAPFMSNPPAGLFSLGFNDVVMKIDRTPASDAMLQELPAYDPGLVGTSDVTPVSFCDPPILPVSKFVTGKIVSKVIGPPNKRSRYDYESEDEPSKPPSRAGTSAEHSMPSTPGRRLFHRNDLAPEMTDVALFNPENKHVRDRLHTAHQFKPPIEFPMPSVSFFESRNSSQWLWEEDQKLRTLVKDYTFNWSLVAQQLSLPSQFVAGSGRRTPWECFERWVQLEGLPAEMSKTQYFRTYQTRLEQAQRTANAQFAAQQQALQQQAPPGQNVSGQQRRRTTQPVRVERRRDNRHLAMIEGMRKLARKREVVAHKQNESQKAAALRKAHEPTAPKQTVHTPQEFSRLRWDREEKIQQKIKMQHEMTLRQQTMLAAAQRQAGMQGMAGMAGMAGQPGMPNGVNQPQRNVTPGTNLNMPAQMVNSAPTSGHPSVTPGMTPRPHPAQQAMQANFPNGNLSGMSMSNTGVPQAQMQATIQGSQRMAPPDQVRMAMQRAQYPASNQHQFQLQQQQINMASNLTANLNIGNGIPNANMVASMASQGMNGSMNPSLNGTANSAGSPRMNQQVNSQMQSPARPLSSGHMPQLLQIQNNLKVQHPEWTTEQLQKAASDHLQRFLSKQRAQAMSAAAGAAPGITSSPQIGNNVYLQNSGIQNTPSPNPVQNYQTQLMQQQRIMSQQQRQQAGSPGMNAPPMSRSATPQNPQQMGMQSPGAPPSRP